MTAKHASQHTVGDTRVTEFIKSLAQESCSVRTISLLDAPLAETADYTVGVPKDALNWLDLAVASLRSARSLLHERFDMTGLRRELSRSNADKFIAEHSYMAESFMHSRPDDAATQLYVNTHLSESDLFAGSRNPLRRLEAAAHGLPVVSTSVGIGSLNELLPLVAFDTDEAMVSECVRLLTTPRYRQHASDELFEQNSTRWMERRPHLAVERWLS